MMPEADTTPRANSSYSSSQKIGVGLYLKELLYGIGATSGLALLWVMEAVRDRLFRLLDRTGFLPRPKSKASAFPPGRPKRRIRKAGRS
jgi:hypothetical protein